MDLNKFIKEYWHIGIAVISAAFVVGTYYMKIEYLTETVSTNTHDIDSLKGKTSFILGVLQKDYPGINIESYASVAQSKNFTPQEIVKDLNSLKTSSPTQGFNYLLQKGFTKEQVNAIYYKPSN